MAIIDIYNGESSETVFRNAGVDIGRNVLFNIFGEAVSGAVGRVEQRFKGGSDVSNIAKKLDTNNIPNMTKQDIIDSIPDDWNYTEHNGFVHIRDADGNIRIRIDPPDKVTKYPRVHAYDSDGNLLDSAGNIVDRKSPDGHIPYKEN